MIKLDSYLKDLVIYITNNFVKSKKILTNFDIDNTIISIDKVLPYGLITTEIISNSIKFGLTNEENPQINVSLKKDDSQIILKISDNGIGFPANFDFQNVNTLGLKIVNSLVGQLEGEIYYSNNNGANIEIICKI